MTILTGLFALAGRFAGRVLDALLGWTTVLLFGKVSAAKQQVLLLIVLGSFAWLAAVAGVAAPSVGTFLLAFVPVPAFIDPLWVRLAMLAAAVGLPLAIGLAAIVIAEPDRRPKGGKQLVAVLRGYPFAITLALTVVVLAGVAIVRKLRSVRRRWSVAHVPMVAKPGRYDPLVNELRDVLERVGISATPQPAPAILTAPAKLLGRVAGTAIGSLVPDRLMLLVGPDSEVLVYPSDIAISAPTTTMAVARAAIASRLTGAPAYQTLSAEGQAVEDQLALTAAEVRSGSLRVDGAFRPIDRHLASVDLEYDEWETLYRIRLQLERDLLREAVDAGPVVEAAAALGIRPGPPSHRTTTASKAPPAATARDGRR